MLHFVPSKNCIVSPDKKCVNKLKRFLLFSRKKGQGNSIKNSPDLFIMLLYFSFSYFFNIFR